MLMYISHSAILLYGGERGVSYFCVNLSRRDEFLFIIFCYVDS